MGTRFLRGTITAALAVVLFAAGSGVAQATYVGQTAADYADTYVFNPNPAYYTFGDDCTNFVSQAMRAGGHKFSGTPSPLVLNNSAQWWVFNGGQGRTYSWSVADKLGAYINGFDPGAGVSYSQLHGSQTAHVPTAINRGDPIFYIWNYLVSPVSYNHVSIMIGGGTDPDSGWNGTLIDEHTTNRRHAIWHLIPYNSQWASTVTGEKHLKTTA